MGDQPEKIDTSVKDTAEDEKPDTTGDGWSSATKQRFDEVTARMKEAEAKAADLEGQVRDLKAELETAVKERADDDETPLRAPAGMSSEEQVQWLIENTNERWFKKRFKGKTPDEVNAILEAVPSTTQQSQRAYWNQLCGAAGIDPDSGDVQAYVAGLVSTEKVTPEKAVQRAAKLFKKPEPRKVPTMETGGDTSEMLADDNVPFDKHAAAAAAAKGLKAPHLTFEQIQARRKARHA